MARITADAVTLDVGHVDALLRRTHAWLAKMDIDAVRIEIDRLNISGPGAKIAFVLRGAQIRVDRQATGAIKGQLTAHTSADVANASELRMVLEQVPGESGGLIRATVDARQVALPSWVVATTAPVFAACGVDSKFLGVLQIEGNGGSVQGVAQGQIDAIALSSLLPAGSPHVAEGQASVEIIDLHWRDRQIETLSGSVRATNLTFNKSLIDAAVGSLCGQASLAPPESVPVNCCPAGSSSSSA
jgi:hypothetical protein